MSNAIDTICKIIEWDLYNMMGLGVDTIQISDFHKQLQDGASVFISRSFTQQEIQYAKTHVSNRPSQHLAVRYAAKEAFVKAWSSLYRGSPPKIHQPNFQEIEVQNDQFGRPYIRLSGQIASICNVHSIQLSLSHDGDYAIAVVIVENHETR